VDLNHATAEQLMTIPGVGPRAAQRIIDHRDEYGRFASVEDLAKVEGFDAGRIAELRGHIRI
jgi:competence protein ComEA